MSIWQGPQLLKTYWEFDARSSCAFRIKDLRPNSGWLFTFYPLSFRKRSTYLKNSFAQHWHPRLGRISVVLRIVSVFSHLFRPHLLILSPQRWSSWSSNSSSHHIRFSHNDLSPHKIDNNWPFLIGNEFGSVPLGFLRIGDYTMSQFHRYHHGIRQDLRENVFKLLAGRVEGWRGIVEIQPTPWTF